MDWELEFFYKRIFILMGKPAARQTIDMAAHTGPLKTGSHDVTIGGFPAAREGDAFICHLHGPGIITKGSQSVTINGVPAARMGDKTSCNIKALPPTKGRKPPQYHYLTPAKKANKDGSIKNSLPDNLSLRILSAYSTQSDEDSDGSFDQIRAGLVLMEFQIKNHWGITKDGIDTTWGTSVAKAEGTTNYIDEDEVYSVSAKGRATGISGNAGISSGKEGSGDYSNVKVEGSVGYADAKASGQIITDPAHQKYGYSFVASAEASVAHGEIEGGVETKYFAAKGTLGGLAGSIGAGGGSTIIFDFDDLIFEGRASGEIALLLGLKGDAEIKIGPLRNKVDVATVSLAGTILSGLPSVIIGG
ncbi:PAAR domain-containing protein [Rahnella victoriana]|uniref:PAAR domain-containing protein n=1 Tax=Rahnella victoriana TaxID=1510570 RepID=UPI001E2B668D|nr:PAAR domain-containing protein [Rahnella victoriana]UHM93059.1 PAAR domain-containing protein [Rahnella victoriana]